MAETYAELLRDPRWQRRRLEIFQRDGWVCTGCADTANELHVHHKRYERGRKPWEYDDEDLVTLRKDCHRDQTEIDDQLKIALAKLPTFGSAHVLGFTRGVLLRDDRAEEVEIDRPCFGGFCMALEVPWNWLSERVSAFPCVFTRTVAMALMAEYRQGGSPKEETSGG